MGWLDNNGLAHFWTRIVARIESANGDMREYIDGLLKNKANKDELVNKVTLSNQSITGFTFNETSGYYEYIFRSDVVTPNSLVTIDLSDIASYDISANCGLLPVSTEGDGTITMYSVDMPSGAMNMDITIIN